MYVFVFCSLPAVYIPVLVEGFLCARQNRCSRAVCVPDLCDLIICQNLCLLCSYWDDFTFHKNKHTTIKLFYRVESDHCWFILILSRGMSLITIFCPTQFVYMHSEVELRLKLN